MGKKSTHMRIYMDFNLKNVFLLLKIQTISVKKFVFTAQKFDRIWIDQKIVHFYEKYWPIPGKKSKKTGPNLNINLK